MYLIRRNGDGIFITQKSLNIITVLTFLPASNMRQVKLCTKSMFEKFFAVTLGILRSPITPLKKGGNRIKFSLFKGVLEGSKTFDTDKRTFPTTSK
jgi:hypothetical protein